MDNTNKFAPELVEALAAGVPRRCTLLFGNEGSGLPPEFAGCGQPLR